LQALAIGKAVARREGKKIAILCFGSLLTEAAQVANQLDATLVDMRFIKPLDEAMVLEITARHQFLVTIEENVIKGGAGSGVNELLMMTQSRIPVLNIGLPDHFIPQGEQNEMRREFGLDAAGIQQQIEARLNGLKI